MSLSLLQEKPSYLIKALHWCCFFLNGYIYIYTPYISFVVSRRISHSNMSVYSHKMALISHICFSFSWLWDRIFLQMTKKTPSPYNGKISGLTWTALNETSIVECTFWSELCIWFCHGWNNERNLICPTWRPETNLFLSINWTEFLAISFFTVFVLKQILKEGWPWCLGSHKLYSLNSHCTIPINVTRDPEIRHDEHVNNVKSVVYKSIIFSGSYNASVLCTKGHISVQLSIKLTLVFEPHQVPSTHWFGLVSGF